MDTLRFKLYLCLALAFFCAGESLSIGVVNWQQGTPQRAGSQTILMWQGYPGAVKYTLTRKEVRSGRLDTWETIAPLYIDRKFDPAQSYDYHIIAYSSDGRPIAVSDTVTLQAERPLKAPVWGGSHQDGGEAFLIWDSDPRAKYHNIFRRQAGGEPKLIASVQQGKYVDKNIIPGLEYVYHLVSVGATGKESPQSDELVFDVELWEGGEARSPATVKYVEVELVIIGPSENAFAEPTDMVVYKDHLYVSDLGSRAITEFDLDGKFIRRFGMMPYGYIGDWGIPWGFDISEDGSLFAITFLKSNKLRFFNSKGQYLNEIEVLKPEMLEDSPIPPQPMDIVFDGTGGYWISENSYAQLIHYNKRGEEMGRVGIPKYIADSEPFRTPTFIARDKSSGDIWIADSLQGKVFRVASDSEIIGYFDKRDEEAGSLFLPKGLAIKEDGDVLVVDGILGSLQSYSPTGILTEVYFSPKLNHLALPRMVSVAIDPKSGQILLASKLSNAIYKLREVIPAQ
ncbi:MAG: hypothetical protein C0609_08510 [Deltaproteobacteria bacterium]|nr:MAG: hypothetical protein C0609_08510 [Deltaproteobacteria bacterium]